MATQTLANISGFLKTHYTPPIQEQLNKSSVLYYRLEKNEEDVAGEDLTAKIPLFYKRNQGIGWRAVGGTLPTAGRRDHTKASVAMAYLYGKIRIAGQAIKASRNNSAAFAKVVDTEINGMVEGLRLEINRALHGRGTGAMSKVTAATGSKTADTLFAVDDASRLDEGMVVDLIDTNAGSGGTKNLDSKTISMVDYRNNKIALSTTNTVTQNDWIYREDSQGNAMMGIEGIVDGLDSASARLVTTLQGISRATNLWWEGSVMDNGGAIRDLSFTLVQQAYELGELLGHGETSLMLSGYAVRRKYVDLCAADKRYVSTLKLDGGFSAIEYSGGGAPTPWAVDRMTLANRLFCIDERSLAVFRAADFDWMDLDGAVLRKVSDVDEYDADCFSYLNLGAYKCNVNTVLRDVA